jgi:putative membrane protein insertion efficiency factor
MRVLWRYLIEVPGKALIVLVRIYQYLLSPLVGQNCRFHPSCSNYMIAAVQKYGAVRGGLRGIGRICRCHPWNPGGLDLP